MKHLILKLSVLVLALTPAFASYTIAKFGVWALTRTAAQALAPDIRVNAIGPGPMDTPFFYGQESAEAVQYHATAAALSPFSGKGLTDIEDIVPWVRFLLSEGWWMTGQTILVNGGYTTK